MGEMMKNLELIQHRNPGTASDWRLRLHFGAAQLDEESPRIPHRDLLRLRQAEHLDGFEAQIRETDWADFWAWLPPDARLTLFALITAPD